MRMEDYPSSSFVAAAMLAGFIGLLGGGWLYYLVAVVMLYYAWRNEMRERRRRLR